MTAVAGFATLNPDEAREVEARLEVATGSPVLVIPSTPSAQGK